MRVMERRAGMTFGRRFQMQLNSYIADKKFKSKIEDGKVILFPSYFCKL